MRFMTMVETGGPLPRGPEARRRSSGGTPTVTDGPFIETKELIGGCAAAARRPGRANRRFGRFPKHRPERDGLQRSVA
jgi:hypothetical protein